MDLDPRTIKNLLNPRKPSYLVFFITNKCNASCFHCFYWEKIKGGAGSHLNIDEIRDIARHLKVLPYLLLSGGEPFLRKDILDICKTFIEECHTRFITIPTNAILTKDIVRFSDELTKQYPEVSLRIQLSLDGIGEKHDEFRGHKGNFAKLMETHDQLVELQNRRENLSVGVVTILCRKNYPWLDELLDFVHHKMKVNQHHVGYLRGQGRAVGAEAISADEFKTAQEKLLQYGVKADNRPLWTVLRAAARRNSKILHETIRDNHFVVGCRALDKFLVLNEDGYLYPCEILDKPLGNVREYAYNIPELLTTPQALELKKWIKDSQCFCTWECALHNNVIFNPSQAPNLIREWIGVMSGL